MEINLEKLLERLERQEQIINELRAENERLKAQLVKNSTNSHKPPSTDSPKTRKERKRRKRSLNKQGAQPGHEPSQRAMLDCDEVVHCIPSQCTHCDKPLAGVDPSPHVHQFVDLPPITAHVTDFHLHRLTCTHCDKQTTGQLPTHVGGKTYGPGVTAWASCLTGQFGLSKRQTRLFLSDLLGTNLSTGTICAMEARATRSLQQAYDEALESVRSDKVLNVDETTWWQKNAHHGWMWTAVGSQATVFRIHDSRKTSGLAALIGPHYEGVLVSDRMKVYTSHKTATNQWCFAHLLCDFEACAQKEGPVQHLAQNLALATRWLLKFDRGHRKPDEPGIICKPSRQRMIKIGEKLKALMEKWLMMGALEERAPSWFNGLLLEQDGMWAWLEHEGVSLTNNAAERALRRAVIIRKTTYGTESQSGDRFVSTMRTITETLKRHGKSTFAFVHSCILAHLLKNQPPALLS